METSASKRLLVLQMGEPLDKVKAIHGSQPDWFMQAIGSDLAQGIECDVVRPFAGEALPLPGSFGAALISGSGAMVTDRADWSERSAEWALRVMQAGIPLFGVCYGHQLMSWALGGKVAYMAQPPREIGSHEVTLTAGAAIDPLLEGLPPQFDAILTHQQTVTELPRGARVLGRSRLDAHQIVRYSDSAFSVQFHPEFTPELIRMYITERREALVAEGLDVAAVLHRVTQAPMARRILRNFVEDALALRAG